MDTYGENRDVRKSTFNKLHLVQFPVVANEESPGRERDSSAERTNSERGS